jgi:phage FluMu protein Com
MGSRNRDRLFGGRIMASEMKAESAKKEAARKIREAHEETCKAWNIRMIGYGGPVQPSPTIEQAVSAGFNFLEVKCRRCSTHSLIDLSAVNDIRRRPETPIWKLEASLRCRHCTEAARNRTWKPAANIVRLRKERTLEFELWYPESER